MKLVPLGDEELIEYLKRFDKQKRENTELYIRFNYPNIDNPPINYDTKKNYRKKI